METSKEVTCVKCGNKFVISYSGYNAIIRKNRENPQFKCPACRSKERSERNKIMNATRWSNPEEHEKMSVTKKQFWDTVDKEKKQEILDKINNGRKVWEENLTDEQRRDLFETKSAAQIKRYQNPLERIKSSNYWKELPDDVKKTITERLKRQSIDYWDNDLNRQKQADRLSKIMEEYWKTRTPEQLEEINRRKSEFTKNYWQNLTLEEREKLSKSLTAWYDKLTDEEKAAITRKRLARENKEDNSLHRRFIESFNSSILSEEFYITPEYPLHTDGIIHCWDYAIYSKADNRLKMVVDLDGSYYHADGCDYDGLHSKEEYDEKRSLTVPDGVILFIIQELNFYKCFKLMVITLKLDYEEYIRNLFDECKRFGFPFPSYSDIELAKSWNSIVNIDCNDKYHQNISVNTRVGDRLIQHFHPSIYRSHRKGEISPYDAWNDDMLLNKVIRNRTIYQSFLNPNKILQGFNVSKIAPKVSVFSAGRAKLIINKYLSEFDTIFDPFSGFSGRMLGVISLHKRYIGQDISEIHVTESNNMIKFLNKIGIERDVYIQQADSSVTTGEYPCLFTCPPYTDKEQWEDVEISTRSCDDWIDICLNNYKCHKYVFVVDETTKYQKYITDTIINKSHMNSINEYIVVIDSYK